MSIKIVLEFDTAEDAITALARYRDMVPSLMNGKGDAVKAADPKGAQAADKNAASKPTADKKEPTKTVVADKKPEPTSASSEPSKSGGMSKSEADAFYDANVQPLIRAKVLVDKMAVLALIQSFGVGYKSGKDLKPEQYADFIAKCEQIGATEDDLG